MRAGANPAVVTCLFLSLYYGSAAQSVRTVRFFNATPSSAARMSGRRFFHVALRAKLGSTPSVATHFLDTHTICYLKQTFEICIITGSSSL